MKATDRMYRYRGMAVLQRKMGGTWFSTIITRDGDTVKGDSSEKIQTATAWTNRKIDKVCGMPKVYALMHTTPEQEKALKDLGWSGREVKI